jgi:hypothetical protein
MGSGKFEGTKWVHYLHGGTVNGGGIVGDG